MGLRVGSLLTRQLRLVLYMRMWAKVLAQITELVVLQSKLWLSDHKNIQK